MCTSDFLSNARFYRLQTALENNLPPPPPPHPTPQKIKRPQRMNEVVFISIETSNFGHWIFIREKKYRKLQCRINERKTPIFNCKTTVVNNAELSSLSGYWSGVPCKNANFACNVISEAGSLAVEKQWFHWLSG